MPSHHVAYLYDYVNKPWKTQKLVREILKTQYKNTASGHCGNEDCGQMSSWYVFSSLGFYPVNAAQGIYALAQLCLNRQLLI
jgi:putative alpha-1,2-mannosidase